MARQKIKSGDIAGYRYVVTQLGAVEGRRVADELIRAVAPAIIEIVGALPEASIAALRADKDSISIDGLLGSVDNRQAQAALDVAMKALPSSRLDALIALLSESTDIYGPGYGTAGAPLGHNFDEHFAGRYKAMFQWLAFAIKVNFSDFFSGCVGEIVTDPQTSAGRA